MGSSDRDSNVQVGGGHYDKGTLCLGYLIFQLSRRGHCVYGVSYLVFRVYLCFCLIYKGVWCILVIVQYMFLFFFKVCMGILCLW